MDGMTMLELLDALLRTMRVIACVTGALVVVDSTGILLNYPERPPHRPRANALAWFIIAAAISGVAAALLLERFGWIGPSSPTRAKVYLLTLWAGVSAGFTARAVTRAPRPWLTIGSALLMVAFGTLLALYDPRG